MKVMNKLILIIAIVSVILITVLLGLMSNVNKNNDTTEEVVEQIDKVARAEAAEALADQAVDLLRKKDVDGYLAIMSPITKRDAPADKLREVITDGLIPFFAEVKEINKSKDIAFGDDDGYGNTYLEVYKSALMQSGETEYYLVVVTEEDGKHWVSLIRIGAQYNPAS